MTTRPIPPLFASPRTPHPCAILCIWNVKGKLVLHAPFPLQDEPDPCVYVRALDVDFKDEKPHLATVFRIDPDATHELDPSGTWVPGRVRRDD